MMKTWCLAAGLLLFCLITFVSCTKEEDESGITCEHDCTVVMGKVYTSDNQPVPGMGFEVEYYKTGNLYYHSIKKAMATSDKNGLYDMKFSLKDKEIIEEEGFFKHLRLKINMDKLDPQKYIVPQDIASIVDASLKLKQDTVFDADFYVPLKRYVPVTLKGFKPIQHNDHFEVQILFPFGFEYENLDSKYIMVNTGYDKFTATEEEQTFTNVPFAMNEYNIIQLFKVKNGVATPEEHKIYISRDSPVDITFEY